jgi:uncharacterized membrane protein
MRFFLAAAVGVALGFAVHEKYLLAVGIVLAALLVAVTLFCKVISEIEEEAIRRGDL